MNSEKTSQVIAFIFKQLFEQSPLSYLLQFVMIIARRILCNTLSSRPLLRYLDSTQINRQQVSNGGKQIKPEAQRALWANHFINTVINQPYTTSIKLPSLRDKLMNSPNPTLDYKLDQAIKEQMLGIFTKGVDLDRYVFNQERISKAAFSSERVIFYPSLLVTKPIFRQMHKSRSRIMFQGCYGIGKTISIAFYIYLSNIINQYAILANKNGEQWLDEYKELVKNELLPLHPKKFWYWSIDQNLVQLQEFSLQRIFAEQATEITQGGREELRNCKTIEQAQARIRQLYKIANITHIAVLDQINHAISKIRAWNQFVQNNKILIDEANKQKKLSEQSEKELKKYNQPATQLISLAKQFTAINPVHYVLNSSVNIEKQLIEENETKSKQKSKKKKRYQELTLKLKSQNKNHQPLKPFQFKFQQQLQLLGGKISFWQFFVCLLEERTKVDLTEQKLQQFKRAFLQYAITWNLKLFYRFLHVRLFLNDYQFSQLQLENFSEENKNEIIKKIIYDFEKSSFYEFQGNLVKFTQKGNTAFKKRLLRAIYVIASQEKDKTKKLNVDFEQVGYMMGMPELKHTLRQYFLSSEHNKEMMPVEEIPNELYKINISWSAEDFMLISNKVLFEPVFKGSMLLPDHQQYIMKNSNVYCGLKVEGLLNQLLTAGTQLIFKTVTNVRELNQKGKYSKSRLYLQEQEQSFEIFDIQNFKSFDTAYKVKAKDNVIINTIEQHFKNVFQKCIQNPGRWYASLPVKNHKQKIQEVKKEKERDEKKEKEDEQISENEGQQEEGVPNNPSVDFAIVRCVYRESQSQYVQQFDIYTYDTTIARSVSKKERFAQNLLKATTQGFKKNIRVHHHILYFKQKGLPVLPVNEFADISYSSIEDLKIKVDKKNEQIRNLFEEVLDFVIKYGKRNK